MQEKERLTAQNGKEPTVEEIAKSLDLRREDIVLALESIVEPVSLYEPVFSDGGDTIYVMDQVGDKNDDKNWLDEIALKEAMNDLSDREKRIMAMRFFQGKTQMEVASEIGIQSSASFSFRKMCFGENKKRVIKNRRQIASCFLCMIAYTNLFCYATLILIKMI